MEGHLKLIAKNLWELHNFNSDISYFIANIINFESHIFSLYEETGFIHMSAMIEEPISELKF
jgi:hypothetical protein